MIRSRESMRSVVPWSAPLPAGKSPKPMANVMDFSTGSLRRRGEFERLLRALSQQLQKTNPCDLDDQINRSLAQIGRIADARGCSLLLVDVKQARLDRAFSWCAPEAEAPVDVMQSVSAEQFATLVAHLESGEIIETDSVDDFALLGDGVAQMLCATELGRVSSTLVPASSGEVIACIALVGWQCTGDSPDTHGLLVMLAQLFVNAIKRRDAERLNEKNQQRLNVLVRETLSADERARRQAATDLHDGIGQNLAVLRMQIASMMEHGVDRDQLEFVQRLVTDSIHVTRGLVKDLCPSSIITELGLAAALNGMTERMGREHGVSISFEASSALPELPTDVRTLLFQAGKEMCINAVKHAAADHISVRLAVTKGSMTLTVRDDGCGFEPQLPEPTQLSGFGLFSLRERLACAGGTLEIESNKSSGASVRIAVPLETT